MVRESIEPFLNAKIELTDLGRSIRSDPANPDWVALNGIDLWLGGVRLLGKENVWRWKPDDSSVILLS